MNKTTRKISAPFTLLAALALGLAAFPSDARAKEHEGEKTELGQKMKAMGKSLKQLKTQLTDSTKQQSSVELLEAAKKDAEEAKKLTPSRAMDVPDAERAKFVSDYQAQIDKLIEQFTKIEDAVKAGKYDDAKKLYNDLQPIKREGHEKYAPKED